MPREEMVSISGGNIKMGKISSVSLPAIVTCRKDCECCKKCYAAKIERLRKTVKVAYQRNWKILQNDPALYWRQVEAAIMLQRYFRFHVSGDIPSKKYLKNMVEISARQPHCQILCFTKRFDFVNDFVTNGARSRKIFKSSLAVGRACQWKIRFIFQKLTFYIRTEPQRQDLTQRCVVETARNARRQVWAVGY